MKPILADKYLPCQQSTHNLVKEDDTDPITEKIYTHFEENPEQLEQFEKGAEKDEQEYFDNLNFKQKAKYKRRYKKRRWAGHGYGIKPVLHVAYLFQGYHLAYGVEGKRINPSKKRLAREIGTCIRTLDKALKVLRELGIIDWVSGKKTWETNTYFLAECYKTTPMRRPDDFDYPKHLFWKIQRHIKIKKLKEFTRVLYEHFLKDIADHLFHKTKSIRTSIEKRRRKSVKASKDPPPKRKKPPNWQLLRTFKLSFKDQWVIGRYSEALLRSAIDDYNFYKKQGKEIVNIPAFLISRCKTHKEKLDLLKKENRTNVKDWITSYFKSRGKRFIFIAKESDLDTSTSEQKPFIQFLKHKANIKKSILKVWQKVGGQWIDKVFNFDRPDLVDSIENYLENSLKFQGN